MNILLPLLPLLCPLFCSDLLLLHSLEMLFRTQLALVTHFLSSLQLYISSIIHTLGLQIWKPHTVIAVSTIQICRKKKVSHQQWFLAVFCSTQMSILHFSFKKLLMSSVSLLLSNFLYAFYGLVLLRFDSQSCHHKLQLLSTSGFFLCSDVLAINITMPCSGEVQQNFNHAEMLLAIPKIRVVSNLHVQDTAECLREYRSEN